MEATASGLGARASRSSPLPYQDGDGTRVGFDRGLRSPGRDGATVVAGRTQPGSVSEDEIAAAVLVIHMLRHRRAARSDEDGSAWRRAARAEAVGSPDAGWRSAGWRR